jgi:phosphatidylglycerophosphate synthase
MSIKELYRFVSKGKLEPFYSSQYFFRYFSVVLSFVFIKLRSSSNFVTILSLVCAVFGAILLGFNSWSLSLISIILMTLYNILDHSDGEIARYEIVYLKKKKGPEGPYLDALVHYIFTPIFFFSLGYSSYQLTGNILDLFAGLISLIWLSSFGQAAALRVSFDYLFAGNRSIETVKSIWKHDKVVSSDQLHAKDVIRKIIREIFSTQGQITLVSLAVILDLIFSFNLSFKTIVLYSFAISAIIGIPKSLLSFYNKLNRLPVKS